MSSIGSNLGRRHFLQGLAYSTCALAARGSFAEELTRTPRQTEGPFYPNRLPLDTDNDLLIINDKITPAVGKVTHLTGRVLGPAGEPVRNAVVEIWQVDNSGIYLHTQSPQRDKLDGNFQGFGRFLTGSSGAYYFRTIKPVPYTFGIKRTPHIHVAVNRNGKRMLTTQLYVKGEPMNQQDFIFQRIRGEPARQSVLVDFQPIQGARTGELAANFDIVIGLTPEEAPAGRSRRG